LSFEDIQAELNYKQAQTALRDLVANLDLTPQERTGLEAEIEQLETMLENLEQGSANCRVWHGRTGKSSLLNALLGQVVCNRSTTRRYSFHKSVGASEGAVGRKIASHSARSWGILVELTPPGLDEVDGETRANLALAKQADLIPAYCR